jgi:Redoxin
LLWFSSFSHIKNTGKDVSFAICATKPHESAKNNPPSLTLSQISYLMPLVIPRARGTTPYLFCGNISENENTRLPHYPGAGTKTAVLVNSPILCETVKRSRKGQLEDRSPMNTQEPMNKFAQKLEIASHLAILIVAILIGIVLVKNYILPTSKTSLSADQKAPAAPQAASAPIAPPSVGKPLSLSGVDWQKNGQTLVMALAAGCRFCTESSPFYKQLAERRAKQGTFQPVAVLPQPVDEGKKYLGELGIAVDDVRQLTPSSIGVRGTPTLLLVNKDGVVTDEWVGKLPPPKEAELLSRLQINQASR